MMRHSKDLSVEEPCFIFLNVILDRLCLRVYAKTGKGIMLRTVRTEQKPPLAVPFFSDKPMAFVQCSEIFFFVSL